MIKRTFLFLALLFMGFQLQATGKPAYQIFNKDGRQIKWNRMVRMLSSAEIVFFGELHNDPIAHWLQLELLIELHNRHGDKLVIGAEMFEADNQLILDEYFAGFFDDRRFESDARLWPNYNTDYKPTLLYARENSIPFIATNIPRRYANMVFRGGFAALDNLPDESKKYIAPLPVEFDIELPGYRNMFEMNTGHSGVQNEYFPKAQAIKDATMAYFILKNMGEENVFYHINGSYHSDNFEGILWYIDQMSPGRNIRTISTVLQEDITSLDEENKGRADFVLVVNSKLTRTY